MPGVTSKSSYKKASRRTPSAAIFLISHYPSPLSIPLHKGSYDIEAPTQGLLPPGDSEPLTQIPSLRQPAQLPLLVR